ncbi:hypothetical protein FM036_05100 [Nostoc sp. HG1]|nr:hypothetical protein [Nostoc sp. HG1]
MQYAFWQFLTPIFSTFVRNPGKAIRLSPDSVDAYKNRGFVYQKKLQNKQEAIKDYQKAATIYKKQGATDKYKKIIDKIQNLQQRKPQSSN